MISLSKANDGILKILAKFQKTADQTRMLHYVVTETTKEGVLLYNLLTKELLLLTEEEFENRFQLDYLKKHWFLVPESTNEKELADMVRWILTTRSKKPTHITGYTILPTTDCNARCFYCFELGRSRIPMTEETAHKVAAYIRDHCGSKKVNICWFGGEPLFNQRAIDIICSDLKQFGVEFKSTVISNGYLFNQETVAKAVSQWGLNEAQISMDGTEAVYNKTKAYIYRNTNPYQIVLDNIENLLNAEVSVVVRLNMDLYNADDLIQLVDELADRFTGHKGLRIYASYIYDGDTPMAQSHSNEEWNQRERVMIRLENRIAQRGLAGKGGIRKNYQTHHCMADSGHCVTILPGGEIGLCEHFSETEFIGHIETEDFDDSVVQSWRKTSPEIPECAQCFYYPDCIRLEKCANSRICFAQDCNRRLRKTKQAMRNELAQWKENTPAEDSVPNDFC